MDIVGPSFKSILSKLPISSILISAFGDVDFDLFWFMSISAPGPKLTLFLGESTLILIPPLFDSVTDKVGSAKFNEISSIFYGITRTFNFKYSA